MEEEALTGGGLNEVVRVGSTVRRPTGPWTPNVHRLLEHLAPLGLSPVVHGVIEVGGERREVLSYLEGEVGHPPLREELRSDEVLVAVARMVRRLHDASVGLVGVGEGWQFPAVEPVEVICHNDLAPYNMVFRDGMPVGVFDFDGARPGPRWWDLAYTAYCLVPFSPEFGGVEEQWRRARLFCEAYGVGVEGLGRWVLARLEDMVGMIRERPEFWRQREEGHEAYYLGHVEYVKDNLLSM
ncbi:MULTISPECIES: aminoglycoside phosphotransferase family protein [Saccharothrix]|uniref:aminoglycoside phosphotransferase family protein n=1 Tax=Saccharothrix TaxID=2071 RepID=UPI0018E9523C|nr:aminoglycoside phosphotransferase family protein [Saccharothrix sp. CB00851]